MPSYYIYRKSKTGDLVRATEGAAPDPDTALVQWARHRADVAERPALFITTNKDQDPGEIHQAQRKAWLDRMIAEGTGWAVVGGKIVHRPAPADLAMLKRDGPANPATKPAPKITILKDTVKPALPALTRATDLDNIGRHGSAYLL